MVGWEEIIFKIGSLNSFFPPEGVPLNRRGLVRVGGGTQLIIRLGDPVYSQPDWYPGPGTWTQGPGTRLILSGAGGVFTKVCFL